MIRPLKRLAGIFFLGAMVIGGAVSAHAKSTIPFFGIQIQGLSPTIANAIGLESNEGVLVRDIAFPGPASRSDLQRGDVIVEIDGKAALNVESVQKMMETFKPGTKVNAAVLRRGKRLDVSIQIGAKPPAWDVSRNNFATLPALGLTFASMTDKVKKRFDIGWRSRGVVVSLVDEEKAAGLDIKVGDVIVQVNQSPVWKPTHIVGFLQKAQKQQKEMVLVLLERHNGFRFALLPVPKKDQ